ncbi:MAG: hypothetical protein LBS21_11695 [Clostridiales bacterium]|nr:hypothetical protein [Clostridiales bacterium]
MLCDIICAEVPLQPPLAGQQHKARVVFNVYFSAANSQIAVYEKMKLDSLLFKDAKAAINKKTYAFNGCTFL